MFCLFSITLPPYFFNSLNWTARLMILLESSGQWTFEIPRLRTGILDTCLHAWLFTKVLVIQAHSLILVLQAPAEPYCQTLHTQIWKEKSLVTECEMLKIICSSKEQNCNQDLIFSPLHTNKEYIHWVIPRQPYWNGSITLDCEQRYLTGFKLSVFQILANSDIMPSCVYMFLHFSLSRLINGIGIFSCILISLCVGLCPLQHI